MTAEVWTIISTGIALAALIVGSTRATRHDIGERLNRMDQRLDRLDKGIETVEHNQESTKFCEVKRRGRPPSARDLNVQPSMSVTLTPRFLVLPFPQLTPDYARVGLANAYDSAYVGTAAR